MGFYSSEVRLDGDMEIDLIGHDPETGLAHVILKKVTQTGEDTEAEFLRYNISMPLPLLTEISRLTQEAGKFSYANTESVFYRPEELPVA